MSKQEKVTREPLDLVELEAQPTLVITKNLQAQINYLHSKCKNREWSGELITSEEGSINDLEDWKITAEDIFLVDIGTSGGTEYVVNKGSYKASDIIEMHETFPDIGEGKKKAQHIHSHHSMKTFFSPTDWENLEDRARASNYVLMLIVNFDGNYKAKVAFLAKEDNKKGSRLSFVNNVDGYKPISLSGSSDKDVLAVMDCKVILEEEVVGEAFKARFNAVIETKLSEEKSKPKSKPHSEPTYSKQGKLYRDDWSYDGGGKKKISDMTDTDWRKFEDIAATEVFGFPHVKALLNSMLDGTYIPGDFTDPIKKIEKEWRDMGRESEKEEWVAEFGDELSEHFDTLFPYRELHQYVQFLEMMMEFLRPYRYSKAIEKIMEEVQLEIDTNKKPIILPYEAGN